MEVQIGPSGPYSSEPKAPAEPAPKKSRKKFWIIVGAFLAFIVLLFGYIFWQAFDLWLGQRRVERTAEAWQKAAEEVYQRQLADTYGGKTPQETLRMYIEAVEKGDYELASKYFIKENRKKELESSNKLTGKQLQDYINFLRVALEKFDVEGRYNDDKNYFSIYEPILIRMILYPNGIWKIEEI